MSSFRSIAVSTCVAALLAVSAAGPAFAQAKPPAKPATPAAPAQPAPAQQAPSAPPPLQLKPEPSQAEWVKICGEDQQTKKKICYTTRDFVSDQGQPVLAVAVYDIQGDPQKIVRFLMPLALLLQPGIRFGVDQGATIAGNYAICFPNGCFAEGGIKDDTIAAFKKGTSLNVGVQNQFGERVTFQVPLAGFAKSFDGPPIDPAVIEQQRKNLEEQMQKQAEEMRKRESGAAPAPAPAPGAPAAPKP